MKKVVFDEVIFKGQPSDVVWKSFAETLSKNAKIYTRKDCDIVFLKKGSFAGAFDDREGYYQLSELKQGFLDKLMNGAKIIEDCEVYYINRKVVLENKWGTPTRIDLYDKDYDIFTSIGASGSYKFSIDNSLKVFSKVSGAEGNIDKDFIKDFFRSEINLEIKNQIAMFMNQNQIGIKDLALVTTFEKRMSEVIQDILDPIFAQYGFKLERFMIHQFLMDEAFIHQINNIKRDAIINNMQQDVAFEQKMKKTKQDIDFQKMKFESEKPYRDENRKDFQMVRDENRKDFQMVTESIEKINKAEPSPTINIHKGPDYKVCGLCNKKNDLESKFCSECGTML